MTVASTGHEDDYAEFIADDYSGANLSLNETEAKSHAFTMPAQDVTIKGAKYYNLEVPYIWWDNGKYFNLKTAPNQKVYVLDGTETRIEGGWYVAKGTISYDHELEIYTKDLHLILADGAEMTVSSTGGKDGISSVSYSLFIYGQSTDAATMGQLTVTATNSFSAYGIDIPGVSIYGGNVTATGTSGIKSFGNSEYKDLYIYGGIVKATGLPSISISNTGIEAQNIWYNGGQVTASGEDGGVYAESTICLDWTNSSDFFKADSYSAHDLLINAGRYFYADGTFYGQKEGNYTFTDKSVLNGKKLIPALNALTPGSAGDTYVGFGTDNGNFKLLGDDVQVYVITGYDLETGVIYLTPVTGNEIPDGVAVIIAHKGDDGSALTNDLMLLGEDNVSSEAEIDGNKSVANFVFGDSYKTLQELIDGITGSTDTPVSDYVVFILKDGKFKPIIANASGKPGQGECLLIIPKVELLKQVIVGGGSSARKLIIDLGNATGIEENAQCTMHNAQSDGEWYDLQGRKLDGQPTTKGVFIHNGNKIVITK